MTYDVAWALIVCIAVVYGMSVVMRMNEQALQREVERKVNDKKIEARLRDAERRKRYRRVTLPDGRQYLVPSGYPTPSRIPSDDPLDEAFYAAFIVPTDDLIAKIDKELEKP